MSGLRHQAVLYEGTDEFLAVTLPFAREAVATGDPLIAVAPRQNTDALREALGDDAEAIDFRYSDEWYVSPGRAFSGFIGFAMANADASCIRMIGEPKWPVGWQAAVAEYGHYESVFNVAAKDAPIWALCPYDIGALPDEVLEHARATHPEVHTGGALVANPDFVDPDAYCSHLASRATEPGIRVRSFPVTADLAGLCAGVRVEAEAAGVSPRRLADFLLAVHEVAANALTHADGPATLRTWTEERSFVCEVESEGASLSETTAGYVPFDAGSPRGRGLWLVRQVCDLVEVRSRDGRTAVRIHARR